MFASQGTQNAIAPDVACGGECTSFLYAKTVAGWPRSTQTLRHVAFLSLPVTDSSGMRPTTKLSLSRSDENFPPKKKQISFIRNEALVKRQIATIFGTNDPGANEFIPLTLAGIFSQARNNVPIDILLLSSPTQSQIIENACSDYLESPRDPPNERISVIPIPMSPTASSSSIRLLSHAYCGSPLSKTKMLTLNSLLINRDGGLYDNLPWDSWTIDPDGKERDAANNVVDGKYAMGKRVAFQRFMGKDWRDGTLSNRLRELLSNDKSQKVDANENFVSTNEEDMMASLSKRLLELEIDEARMEVAKCEQQLAIRRTELLNNGSGDDLLEYSDFTDPMNDGVELQMLNEAQSRLQVAKTSLEELENAMLRKKKDMDSTSPFSLSRENEEKNGMDSSIRSALLSIVNKLDDQKNETPYRGAIGYPPKMEPKDESGDSSQRYTSPYHLMLEIINEQLNADVVACVLEQTSLLEGNLVLGGALLLQRKGRKKSTTLAGERVDYVDSEDDFGNEGVYPQSTYVVECFSDEAIGMALETGSPLYLESGIWERAGCIPVEISLDETPKDGNTSAFSVMSRLPLLRPVNGLSVSVEGEKVSSAKEANAVRIPLPSSAQIFDNLYPVTQSSFSNDTQTPVFSTYTPVSSLDQYDSLTNDDKARMLFKLESFQGVLPRPRAVRASESPSELDNILLPLIDESIRNQYLIRDAERRQDFDTANALRSKMSQRQSLLEQARSARESGLEDKAKRLDDEAELYKALRADFTQDVGAYSRYLDRDDWYERETQARIQRLKKSKGID
eukprot:CCRYP_000124-RA/>CCRYP_000124-RA protein AED:0.03 eAED:0.03 QI:138/1/1/1/0/0/2/71/791